MESSRICNGCRQPLPENAPEGLCPACLAKAALDTDPPTAGATINVNPVAAADQSRRVPPDPAQLAAQFPQLEIIELLGMGGMGTVYKARQTRLDRFVALKILPLASASHPSFAERFDREAKALAKLNHPGIVAVYDFGQTDQYYYFVMEYVDGMNLRRLLNTQNVTRRQALDLVVQICTALQHAHDEGVVHRDIKPENILLNQKGQVKIADFGLAKLLGSAPDTALTMSQAAMGTLNYMAPEQRENAQKVDHRADLYSLGVVFYEMLTGEVPMGKFAPPSKKVQIDVRLDEVVLRALEREPARRYQQASELKGGVEAISNTKDLEDQRPGRLSADLAQSPRQIGVSTVSKPVSTINLLLLAACLLSVLIPAAPLAWLHNRVEIGSVQFNHLATGFQWTFGPVSEVNFRSSGLSTWHGKGIGFGCLLCGAFLFATSHSGRFARLRAFTLSATGLLALLVAASFLADPPHDFFLSRSDFESMRNLPRPVQTQRTFLGDEQQSRDLLNHYSYEALKVQNDRVHWMRTAGTGPFITMLVGLSLLVTGGRSFLTPNQSPPVKEVSRQAVVF
jgi:serine/threonine protein kinase